MITIGLPVFNAAPYLKLTLNSIFSQDFKDWKLIIINDGSTDESEKIIQPFLKDKRVQYQSGTNKGLGYRLNQITEMVETPYYARMDADDAMFPKRLSTQLEFLQTHPKTDLVGSSIISINEHNQIVGERIVSNDFSTRKILFNHPLNHPTIMGKTEWFKKNPYHLKYARAEDRELWVRTHQFTRFHNIKEPLMFYREGNIDVRNYDVSKRTARLIYADYKPLFHNKINYQLSLLKEFSKAQVYHLFGLLNAQNILTRMRSSAISQEEKKRYQETLDYISGFESGCEI